ncbi:MAG: hypothetical protein WED82_02095 [Balneolales bacterium]
MEKPKSGISRESLEAEKAQKEEFFKKKIEQLKAGMKLKPAIVEKHGNHYGFGVMECPICDDGKLKYRYFGQHNGHIQLQCSTEDCINFRE